MAKATDKIRELLKGNKPAPTPTKVSPVKSVNEKKPPKEDGRKNNHFKPGTANEEGRPPIPTLANMDKKARKQLMHGHFIEVVKVRVKDPTTGVEREIEKPRLLIQLERLYQASYQDGKFNDAAIDRWLNRALGKAPQPIVGDDDEDPVRTNQDVMPALDKEYEDEE